MDYCTANQDEINQSTKTSGGSPPWNRPAMSAWSDCKCVVGGPGISYSCPITNQGKSDCDRGNKLRVVASRCERPCNSWDSGNWRLVNTAPGSGSKGVRGSNNYDGTDGGSANNGASNDGPGGHP